jgi:hypothetical protein
LKKGKQQLKIVPPKKYLAVEFRAEGLLHIPGDISNLLLQGLLPNNVTSVVTQER